MMKLACQINDILLGTGAFALFDSQFIQLEVEIKR